MRHPTQDLSRRVAVFGCKHTTLDLIRGLARQGYRVDHCVTLSPEKAASQEVAGYLDLRPYLEAQEIPYTVVQKYSLRSDEDQAAISALRFDAALVMGWQRLLPNWLLSQLSIGAFGMHGSSRPLPHGRGRSPMNWSLIQGKTEFFTHLFQYLPGVDDGPVVGVQRFDINPYDTALTLHFKNLVAMTQLCVSHLPGLLDGTAARYPQPKGEPTYYPKRGAEDGLLYFEDRTEALYNLVRAVTSPFPGAFAFLGDQPILIWEAIPFDTQLQWPAASPGEIVEVFFDGRFVVKTGDGSLLVLRVEGHHFTEADLGRHLTAGGRPRKVWTNLPD